MAIYFSKIFTKFYFGFLCIAGFIFIVKLISRMGFESYRNEAFLLQKNPGALRFHWRTPGHMPDVSLLFTSSFYPVVSNKFILSFLNSYCSLTTCTNPEKKLLKLATSSFCSIFEAAAGGSDTINCVPPCR